MARVRAYIDGLNLFYGALKGHQALKWLDVVRLVEALRPDDEIEHVRYFTAPVSGRMDPGHSLRQEVYLRAIRANPRVTVHLGRFRSHPVFMPLATPLTDGTSVVRVVKTEEKGSDVNLATYLLLDGVDRLYDAAVVVSNDTDLVEPIAMANFRYGPVHVVRPTAQYNNEMARSAASYTGIPAGTLERCQLPLLVDLPNGKFVTRPIDWS